MIMDKLNDLLKEFDIKLSPLQLEQFQKYYEMLIEKNKVMNLTAITEFDEVLIKHFADSLALVLLKDKEEIVRKILTGEEVSMADIGTGAGFPSLPLKIAFPNLHVTMIDSLHKRVKFLNEVIDALSLEGISALHGRAEEYAKPSELRETFDIVVSRAVANMSTLSEYCIPYVKVGGIFVAYKSSEFLKEEDESSELIFSQKAVKVLGGNYDEIKEYTLPGSGDYRCLACIGKVKQTPPKYPRKAGLPGKEPIA